MSVSLSPVPAEVQTEVKILVCGLEVAVAARNWAV